MASLLLCCKTVLSISFALVIMPLHVAARENETHFHFYFHDIYTGSHPSAIKVVSGPLAGPGPRYFGDIVVLDNPLTEEPNLTSKHVGRAQGFAVRVSHDGTVSELTMHVVFEDGEYKGCGLAILGRIDLKLPVRESLVAGGSGCFRLARGYAFSRNYDYNLATGGIVEFDVYVVHK